MNIYQQLTNSETWAGYLAYKKEHRHLTRYEEKDITEYINNCEYIEAVRRLFGAETTTQGIAGHPTAGHPATAQPAVGDTAAANIPDVGLIPEKKQIRKMQTDKKRVVYMYPREINYVLKLMTFLLLRKYDGIFSDNLYSFRVNTGVNRAMTGILNTPGLKNMYTYKVDISNYFNSIPVDAMCTQLGEVLRDDPEIAEVLTRLIQNEYVLDKDILITEPKGVMAGTPFAVFLANVYLMDMDKVMSEEEGLIYARYSDDIIVITDSSEKRDKAEKYIRETLRQRGLSINEKKEIRTAPGETWSFLGIEYCNGKIDISAVSKDKIKAKIRRRARAIKRWQIRKGLDSTKAVKAFIKAMNKKFFDPDSSHELTWARWYFPLINTDETLKELDNYMQQWIRYLATGHHNKKSYEFTYEQMKELGYISLVHEWYR